MRPLKIITYFLFGCFIYSEYIFPSNALAKLEKGDEQTAHPSSEIRRGRTLSHDQRDQTLPQMKRRYFSAPHSFLGGKKEEEDPVSFIGVMELWPADQASSSTRNVRVPDAERASGTPIFLSRDWHDGMLSNSIRSELQALRAQQQELEVQYRQMMKRTAVPQRRDSSDDEATETAPNISNNGWSTKQVLYTTAGVLVAVSPVVWVPYAAALAMGYTALAVGSTELVAGYLMFWRRSTS